MSVWITVYCRRSVGDISAEKLEVGIRGRDPSARAGVDYLTLAEDYGVNEKLVRVALSNLKVRNAGQHEFERYELDYGASRPDIVLRWYQPDRVAEEVEEVIKRLRIPQGWLAERIRASCEVVGIELGISQLKDMGVVIAYEVARYLAQRGDGLVLDTTEEWLKVEDGAFLKADDET